MENEQPKQSSSSEMRKAWFDHVRKTRVKMSRGQKTKATHREAMKAASVGWAAEKAKLLRKIARDERKKSKS